MNRLVEAIRTVLGPSDFDALRSVSVSVIQLHDMAMRKAFVYDMRGDAVDVLREYARHLEEHGEYPSLAEASK